MKAKYKRGIVIGKFYPFHNGHKFLIETGLKNCEKLTVIVCQTDRYKIPAETRAGWIRETFPNVDIRILNHSASLDSESTDISETWAKLTIKFLGYIPDVVFSSELYGEPYSRFMGSHHVLVDLERRKVPISATKIRSDISKHWDFLPESTKNYFTPKIVILGAESTGTTTLAKDLATHFKTVWVPEYGRLYYEGKMSTKDSEVWTTDEFIHIANTQNQTEDALIKRANRLLICDTDAFATTLWHERYVGHRSVELEKIVKSEKPSLYILTDVDIPFVQDGTRDGEHIRSWMHQRFIEKLQDTAQNYIIVSGSKKKRLAESIKKVLGVFTFLPPELP